MTRLRWRSAPATAFCSEFSPPPPRARRALAPRRHHSLPERTLHVAADVLHLRSCSKGYDARKEHEAVVASGTASNSCYDYVRDSVNTFRETVAEKDVQGAAILKSPFYSDLGVNILRH